VELEPGQGPGTVFNEIYEQKVERTLFDPTFVLDYPAEVSPWRGGASTTPGSWSASSWWSPAVSWPTPSASSTTHRPARRSRNRRVSGTWAHRDAAPGRGFLEASSRHAAAGGLGIAVDRLVMLLTDSPSIRTCCCSPPCARPAMRRLTRDPLQALRDDPTNSAWSGAQARIGPIDEISSWTARPRLRNEVETAQAERRRASSAIRGAPTDDERRASTS